MTGADGRYRRYTDTEIAAANETDLPDLLEHLGYRIQRVGRCYTTREMDSLRIWDRRTWYRYSESIGGDAIAFLRHFHGMSFSEAVKFLLEYSGRDPPAPQLRQRPRPPPRPPFVLPPPYRDNQRVYAYLRGRGIALGVIRDFVDAGLAYEDVNHNAVFVGYGSSGNPVFATKRGTGSVPFRCDVSGSDKHIAFRLRFDSAVDRVWVFEAPIDLMSFCTLHQNVTCNAVALCGLHDAPLETYLDENPGVRRIILCLDADGPGREAAGRIGAKYRERGYVIEDLVPPSGKDWNEYLRMIHPGDPNRT